MIKHVIQLADLHIPNEYNHHGRPYLDMIKSFLSEIYAFFTEKGFTAEDTRIVICGDIFHQKIKTSNEALDMFHTMLNYLDAICPTYIFAGNHDMLENNKNRLDSLSPTFSIKDIYQNVVYLDKELDYSSGEYEDDNVVWVLYSMHDKYNCDDVSHLKNERPDIRVIGLYHGNVTGATTDMGYQIDNGLDTKMFAGCDCVMAGHIHRFQEIRKNGVPIIYASSLFQQDSSENISGHGFVVWNLEDMSYEFHEVENKYRILRFDISSYDDVDEDVERLVNL